VFFADWRALSTAATIARDGYVECGRSVNAVAVGNNALQLAKDNAELNERSMRLADHWKFMYELEEKQNARPTLAPELEARLDKVLKACDVKALPVN
jgi:hypothetical protein